MQTQSLYWTRWLLERGLRAPACLLSLLCLPVLLANKEKGKVTQKKFYLLCPASTA